MRDQRDMRHTEWAMPTTQSTRAFANTLNTVKADAMSAKPMPRNAVLTIDPEGRITECNPEAKTLLGWETDGPWGRCATAVIPTLPFSPNTPGYNLAYAIFHAANGIWMPRMAYASDGRALSVDTALSSKVVNSVRHIVLSLRPTLGAPRLDRH